MKTWKHFSIVGILAIFCILFTGCSNPEGPHGVQGPQGIDGLNSYLVIFDSNGGIPNISVAAVSHGEKVNEPDIIPIKNSTGIGEFIGWYEDKNLTTPFNFDAPITANITLYANYNLLYKIGETGPGGGKIFFRSESGFIMTDTNEICHYLEVSPNDVGTNLKWSSNAFLDGNGPGLYGWYYFEGTAEGIGTGRKNTAIILGIDADAPVAKVCNDYSNNGKSDWFLPSIDELFQLRINKDFVNDWKVAHWSSSVFHETGSIRRDSNGSIRVLQLDYDYPYSNPDDIVCIANARNPYAGDGGQYFVRAVRAF